MSEATNNDIFRELGKLSANVEGLRRDLSDSEDRSRDYRESIYSHVEEVEIRTAVLEDNFKTMAPAIQGLTNLRAKAAGVVLALGVVGAIIGGVLTYFADEIKHFILRLLNIH